jgi:hypothetical protein
VASVIPGGRKDQQLPDSKKNESSDPISPSYKTFMEADPERFVQYDELSAQIKSFIEANTKTNKSNQGKRTTWKMSGKNQGPNLKEKATEYKTLISEQEVTLKAITEECLNNKDTYIIEGRIIEMRLVACIIHNNKILKDVGRKLKESKELADAANKQVKEYESMLKCHAELEKLEEAEKS